MNMISIGYMNKAGLKEKSPESVGITKEFLYAFRNDSEYMDFCKRASRARREALASSQFYVFDSVSV